MTALIPDVCYATVDGRPLLLDILRPDPLPARPMPAIVELHPGAWMYGGKLAERNRIFAEHGFLTISIDYRHSGEALFPAQIADVKAAVRWLRSNAGEHHVDPTRVGVWGESSGGHLASLLGASGDRDTPAGPDDHREPSAAVQAVATVSGPSDLIRLNNQFVAALLGGPPGERRDLAELADPITFIDTAPSLPPYLIVHGATDDQVPLEQGRLLQQALESAGAEVSTAIFPTGHNLINGPYAADGRSALLEFFSKHLSH